MHGITSAEAKKALAKFGRNDLSFEETSLFDILFAQLRSPFFILLLLTAFLSIFFGEKIDTIILSFFAVLNVSIGFFQEYRAQRTISTLKRYFQSPAKVLRDGALTLLDKKFLVPGDIICLIHGDIVPADARLIQAENLTLDESTLTGESFPQEKASRALPQSPKEIFFAKNMTFASTKVVTGEGRGIVVATGRNTFFGSITAEFKKPTLKIGSLEKELRNVSKVILTTVLISVAVIFLAKFFLSGVSQIGTFFLFCIALVIVIIPEPLPTVVAFSLSRGARKLAKKGVVTRHLLSIEDLGSIETLCIDKTGTITENKLSLEEIKAKDPQKCLLYSILLFDEEKQAAKIRSNNFNAILFDNASKEILEKRQTYEVIKEIPFDPERRCESVLMKPGDGKCVLAALGAPEELLDKSLIFEGKTKDEFLEEIKKESSQGKRVLALAYKEFAKENYSIKDEKGFIFAGYFIFSDPIKKDAQQTLELANELGVRIKVLSGDSKEVCEFVSKKIGLLPPNEKAVLGNDLEQMDKKEYRETCLKRKVFARLTPKHKLKIVKTLQEESLVGFMGDGVNDIPPMEEANVALAVAEATDATKEIADIVLLQRNLKALVEGIKEGRIIYNNIIKYLRITLASNFGNFYSVALVSLFIPYLPILPTQIFLLNVLSDAPMLSIPTDNVDGKLLKKPEMPSLRDYFRPMMLLALISSVFDLIFFAYFKNFGQQTLQTFWSMESILTEVVLIFSFRTMLPFWQAKPPSKGLIASIFAVLLITLFLPFTFFGQYSFHFITPTLPHIVALLLLVLTYLLLSEFVKFELGKRKR